MTTGEFLYLLMCLAMFGVFGLTLAYYSAQQTKADRAKRQDSPAQPTTPKVVTP